MVEQWARNYLQAVQRRPAPHKRARISSYLFIGLERFGMSRVAGAIPTLLHISLFLFLAGLVEFLLPINPAIAYLPLGILVVCLVLYTVATFLPIRFGNCPYQTPLSDYIWRGLQLFRRHYQADRSGPTSMERARETVAIKASPARDRRDCDALRWTLESLTEDFEFQPFVEGIPGFLRSKSVVGSHGVVVMTRLLKDPAVGLGNRIKMLLKTCEDPHTLSSNLKRGRAMACMDAIWCLTTQSFQVDPLAGADWNTWCSENLANLVKKFKSDPDPVVSNSAFTATTVLVHQLLWDYSMLPRVTEQDLDQLQRYIYTGDVTSARTHCFRLGHALHMAGNKGLELLEAADWLIRSEVKEKVSDWKLELPNALENAAVELESYLVTGGTTVPSKVVRSSIALASSFAMPRIGHGSKPPIKTREALQLLVELRDLLKEVRFELLMDYVSKLTEKTSLSEKALDTLRLVMFDLPECPHPRTQSRMVDYLYFLINYNRNVKGVMNPAIDVLLDIIRYLDEEEPTERAENFVRSYLTDNPRSRAGVEAFTFLQKFSSS